MDELYQHFLKSSGVSTDTRAIKEGQIFFALKGENFDGNLYAEKAIEAGAALAVVDDQSLKKHSKMMVVGDALESLQALARHHRRQFSIPFIAITGSNGKTTTKELCHAVLSQKFKVQATRGNFNNHIGVPLTLLSIPKDCELAIIEMGANHLGEIDALCQIAEPDYGLITNIGSAHVEGFGSLENIAIGKTEMYRFLDGRGKVFVNREDAQLMERSAEQERILYPEEAFRISSSFPGLVFGNARVKVEMQLVGAYNLPNAMVAWALGKYFGVQEDRIIEALESYEPRNNRSQVKRQGKFTFIMDAYNANPSSMRMALQNLTELEPKTYGVILGDMFELGASEGAAHREILDLVNELDPAFAFVVGERFSKAYDSGDLARVFGSTEDCVEHFRKMEEKDLVILIKGSRSMGLERLVGAADL